LKKSRMVEQLIAFRYLLKDISNVQDKIKLICLLSIGKLFPSLLQRFACETQIEFKNFILMFRISQGELTPYREIKELRALEIFGNKTVADWVIIDGGANIGLFSLFFKDAKKIIAVEPNPECYRRLVHNFTKNNIKGHTLNVALGSSIEKLKLMVDRKTTVLSTVGDTGNISVDSIVIDQIISDYDLGHVDLLKLDLEGSELAALVGAKKSLTKGIVKMICAEFNSEEALHDMDTYLIKLDYKRIFVVKHNAFYCPDAQV
jgi:FkbM family methyltransferase